MNLSIEHGVDSNETGETQSTFEFKFGAQPTTHTSKSELSYTTSKMIGAHVWARAGAESQLPQGASIFVDQSIHKYVKNVSVAHELQ